MHVTTSATRSTTRIDATRPFVEYRDVIRLDPHGPAANASLSAAHSGLGNIFYDESKRSEAFAEDREAIRLDPKAANPQHGPATRSTTKVSAMRPSRSTAKRSLSIRTLLIRTTTSARHSTSRQARRRGKRVPQGNRARPALAAPLQCSRLHFDGRRQA